MRLLYLKTIVVTAYLAGGFVATAQSQVETGCNSDLCRLETRLEALLPRIENLGSKLEAARLEANSGNILRTAIEAYFERKTADQVSGPCGEYTVTWSRPEMLLISIKSKNSESVKLSLLDLATAFEGLSVEVTAQNIEICVVELAKGITIPLTGSGPRREKRALLDPETDVAQLPDEKRCEAIGELVDNKADKLQPGLPVDFWVRHKGGSVVLCAKNSSSGSWSVRPITSADLKSLVVAED